MFFECSDEVLYKRYKETRRKHPSFRRLRGLGYGLGQKGKGNARNLKGRADYIIDTTQLSPPSSRSA